MILQAVPAEDSDEEEEVDDEDATLYGKSSSVAGSPDGGHTPPGQKPPKGRLKKLKRNASKVVHKAHLDTSAGTMAAICCVGAVAVGLFIMILSRYGRDSSVFGGDAPMLVVFSFSPGTDAAVAWLTAGLLNGRVPPNTTESAVSLFTPEDPSGMLLPGSKHLDIWTPPMGDEALQLQALAHGEVSGLLHRVHRLGSPRVRDVSELADGPKAADSMSEADVFLTLRAALADAAEKEEEADASAEGASESGGGGGRRLDRKRAQLVLVSHPHHLPYLSALALSSGFRPLSLAPEIYSRVPWTDFGCGPLGYSEALTPLQGIKKERARLNGFGFALENGGGDEQRAELLQSVLAEASATMAFHQCVVSQTTTAHMPAGAHGVEAEAVVQACRGIAETSPTTAAPGSSSTPSAPR